MVTRSQLKGEGMEERTKATIRAQPADELQKVVERAVRTALDVGLPQDFEDPATRKFYAQLVRQAKGILTAWEDWIISKTNR